jgi:hypothetical protein
VTAAGAERAMRVVVPRRLTQASYKNPKLETVNPHHRFGCV